jgi:hypothetical protein
LAAGNGCQPPNFQTHLIYKEKKTMTLKKSKDDDFEVLYMRTFAQTLHNLILLHHAVVKISSIDDEGQNCTGFAADVRLKQEEDGWHLVAYDETGKKHLIDNSSIEINCVVEDTHCKIQ